MKCENCGIKLEVLESLCVECNEEFYMAELREQLDSIHEYYMEYGRLKEKTEAEKEHDDFMREFL